MNRYEEELTRAFNALNQMQDEHLIIKHELRDALAENKRLRHALYSDQPRNRRWQDRMDSGREGRPEFSPALDALSDKHESPLVYFDVSTWLWTAYLKKRVES